MRPAHPQTTPRPPRWPRRFALLLLVIAIVAALALHLVTRSWFIVARLGPQLEARLGASVTIDSASYEGGGRFLIRGLAIRSPEHEGPAAEIMHVGEALVDVDLMELLRRRVRFLRLDLDNVTVRLSEDAKQSGGFNLTALQPRWESDPQEAPAWPPTITIHRAAIEVGQHDGAGFTLSGRRRVRGSMQHDESGPGRFRFNLDEISEDGSRLPDGVTIEGLWDVPAERLHSQVQGLALDRRAHGMCPGVVRLWWDRMELSGRLGLAQLDWSAADGMRVRFDVDDVGLTLPVEAPGLWARYQDGDIVTPTGQPRMQVRSGTIRLVSNELLLDDLVGELRSVGADEVPSVPYEVTLRLGGGGQAAWTRTDRRLDEVLRTAPFTLIAKARQSTGPRGEAAPAPTEVPVQLARLMQRFRLRDWQLDTEVQVQRGDPQPGPDGALVAAPLRLRGRADVLRATGAYEKFPYLLEEIQAQIEFDEETISINSLTARGAGEGRVALAGQVSPLSGQPGVDLTLKAQGLVLDERLRAALRPGEQRIFDDLFHAPSATGLQRADLLPEGFEPGGIVDLDLAITRAAGPDQPTTLGGTVNVRTATVLPQAFPYPVRAEGGTLLWETTGVRIADGGLPITTPGGGRGTLSGEVELDHGPEGTRARPRLSIALNGNHIQRALLAAIPPPRAQREILESNQTWPGPSLSEAAETIASFAIAGELDSTGTIAAGPDGAILYDFDLTLANAAATIPERWRGGLAPGVEATWTVAGLAGRVHVSNREVWLDDLNGQLNQSPIHASGRIALGGDGAAGVTVRVDDVRFDGESLAAIADGGDGLEWLRQADPHGVMAVEYEYRGTGASRLSILPSNVTFAIGDQLLSLRRTEGAIDLRDGRLTFEGLGLAVRADDESQGQLMLRGAVGRAGEDRPAVRLSGTWTDGRFESPIVARVMGEHQALLGSAAAPRGIFDADFEVIIPPGPDEARLRATLRPRTLSMERAGSTIQATFDPGSRILVGPDLVQPDPLSGMLHGVGGFDVRGSIGVGSVPSCDLMLEFHGDLRSPTLAHLLPAVATSALDAMGYQDAEGSEIVDGRLRLDADAPGGPWRGSLTAGLITHGAACGVGVDLADVHGRFDVAVEWGPQRPVGFQMNAAVDRIRAQGHLVERLTARANLVDDGSAIAISDISGSLHGGAISAEAKVGLDQRHDWALQVSVAGAGLDEFLGQAAPEPRTAATGESAGLLYGAVALSGARGAAGSRRGRGMARALGGVTQLPLVLRIMQVTQLTAPLLWGDPDYLDSEFFIAGNTLTFERLLLESSFGQTSPFQLLGTGDLDLQSNELDATFRSRGGWFFRDVLGEIGDQLYVIRVIGPLSNPVASVVALPGLRGTRPKLSDAAGSARVPEN